MRMDYATAEQREQFRMASENPVKIHVVERLMQQHEKDSVLIIGQYLSQLDLYSEEFNAPIITGKTPSKEREEIFSAFRKGEYRVLIVSKVANFAIDLPDANVAIQVSGTFGSRQEEAQRLGRVLRPKGQGIENIAHFYSVTTKDTSEQEFANKRQRFLTEQGYNYAIEFQDMNDQLEKRSAELWERISALWAARRAEEEEAEAEVVSSVAGEPSEQ
jgi:DNA excision repair protein ERCC-3